MGMYGHGHVWHVLFVMLSNCIRSYNQREPHFLVATLKITIRIKLKLKTTLISWQSDGTSLMIRSHVTHGEPKNVCLVPHPLLHRCQYFSTATFLTSHDSMPFNPLCSELIWLFFSDGVACALGASLPRRQRVTGDVTASGATDEHRLAGTNLSSNAYLGPLLRS